MKDLIVFVINDLWSWSEAKAVNSVVKRERTSQMCMWFPVFVYVVVVLEFETAFA